MTGLQPGWEALPRTSAVTRTTSASGQAREETLSGVPLAQAFISPPQERVRIQCADGAALLVSAADAIQALLAPLRLASHFSPGCYPPAAHEASRCLYSG